MTINKFQGKTKEEAIEKARLEFGPNAVIMNVKEVKPKGIFSVFKSSTFEVTAAIEDKSNLANPMSALMPQAKVHGNINLSADEDITIPQYVRPSVESETDKTRSNTAPVQPFAKTMAQAAVQKQESTPLSEDKQFKERLDNLSDLLEQRLSSANTEPEESVQKAASTEEMNFIRILYTTLIKNEVHEKYVNQVLDEVEKFIRPGNNVDLILPNIYQKLILKFGQPKTIELSGKKPNVIFFIGPTGVGKTTTIAKIASKYRVEYNRKVAFITADTYRIAATEQLRVYANILDAPMSIVYSVDEINAAIEEYMDYDLIFVDTAGFSHKNEKQREDTKNLLQGVHEEYRKEVYLVLSATTKYNDLMDIVDIYREISDYKLIFTKLDETSTYGNLLNIKLYADADLSYVTIGQNVPDDIEVFDTQKIVKQLLGGR